jgi:hypothetical protein
MLVYLIHMIYVLAWLLAVWSLPSLYMVIPWNIPWPSLRSLENKYLAFLVFAFEYTFSNSERLNDTNTEALQTVARYEVIQEVTQAL